MKRVASNFWLPAGWEAAREALSALLREHGTSINQAAEGQLRTFVNKVATYVAGEQDLVIQVAPTAPMAVTLPAASAMREKVVTVKRTNGTSHTVTVTPAAGLIDGSANSTQSSAYDVRHFFSDGTNYWIH